MNTVALSGRIYKTTHREIPGDAQKTVSNFTLGYYNARKKETEFFNCTAFGKKSFLEQFFPEGSPIEVVGRLTQESWEDKETKQKRSKIVIVVNEISFAPKASESKGDAPPAKLDDGAEIPNPVPDEVPF